MIIIDNIIMILLQIIGLIVFACVLSGVIDIFTGWRGPCAFIMLRRSKKEKEMKLWNKSKKLTATDDLVDFILMKLYEEPDKWDYAKSGGFNWWKYQNTNIYVRADESGEIYHYDREIQLSRRQIKRIVSAATNIRSAKALREMMKVAVKNAT